MLKKIIIFFILSFSLIPNASAIERANDAAFESRVVQIGRAHV